jgi:2',3'-cyclic-nucleotide 2'-phosphodiesterase (5'-nucleotidase family)
MIKLIYLLLIIILIILVPAAISNESLLKFKDINDNCSITPSIIKSNGKFHKIVNITLLLTSDRHGHMKTLSKLKHIYDDYKKIGPTFLVDAGDVSIGAEFAYYYGASKILEGNIN